MDEPALCDCEVRVDAAPADKPSVIGQSIETSKRRFSSVEGCTCDTLDRPREMHADSVAYLDSDVAGRAWLTAADRARHPRAIGKHTPTIVAASNNEAEMEGITWERN